MFLSNCSYKNKKYIGKSGLMVKSTQVKNSTDVSNLVTTLKNTAVAHRTAENVKLNISILVYENTFYAVSML